MELKIILPINEINELISQKELSDKITPNEINEIAYDFIVNSMKDDAWQNLDYILDNLKDFKNDN